MLVFRQNYRPDPNPDELKAVRKRYDQELIDFP